MRSCRSLKSADLVDAEVRTSPVVPLLIRALMTFGDWHIDLMNATDIQFETVAVVRYVGSSFVQIDVALWCHRFLYKPGTTKT